MKSLLRAAAMAAQAELATCMEAELAKIKPSGAKVQDARAQLRAVGTGISNSRKQSRACSGWLFLNTPT